MKFRDLQLDTATPITALLKDVTERVTKSGNSTYCELTLCDGEQDISAKLWNTDKEKVLQKVEIPSVISGFITSNLYQGNITYQIANFGKATGEVDMNDYIITASAFSELPIDAEKMYKEICQFLDLAANGNIHSVAMLVKTLYEENKEQLLYQGAAKKVHHDFKAGLLFHTYRMVRSAYRLCKDYRLDREIMIAGTAVHDLGKLKELETDPLGVSEYTLDGSLFGHLLQGILMLEDVASRYPGYDPEKLRHLEHIVASHHGKEKHGAIHPPMTKEAMMVHLIDKIDSQMNVFEKAYLHMEPGEITEGKVFPLKSAVYKPY